MYGRCETDPFDQAIDVCGSCYGEFCQTCLVPAKGKKLPVCKECTVIASGVRPGTKPLLRGSKKTAQERRQTLQQANPEPPTIDYFDEADQDPTASSARPTPSPPASAPPAEAPAPPTGPPDPASDPAPPPQSDTAPPQPSDTAPPQPSDTAPRPPSETGPSQGDSRPTSPSKPDRAPSGMAALARYKAEATGRSAPNDHAPAAPAAPTGNPDGGRTSGNAPADPQVTNPGHRRGSYGRVAAGRGWSVQLPQPGSTGLPARRRGDRGADPSTNHRATTDEATNDQAGEDQLVDARLTDDQGPRDEAPVLTPALPRRRSKRAS